LVCTPWARNVGIKTIFMIPCLTTFSIASGIAGLFLTIKQISMLSNFDRFRRISASFSRVSRLCGSLLPCPIRIKHVLFNSFTPFLAGYFLFTPNNLTATSIICLSLFMAALRKFSTIGTKVCSTISKVKSSITSLFLSSSFPSML